MPLLQVIALAALVVAMLGGRVRLSHGLRIVAGAGAAALSGWALWTAIWQALPLLVLAMIAVTARLAGRAWRGRRWPRLQAGAMVAGLLLAVAPYALVPIFALPAPGGPAPVGTLEFSLTDRERTGVMEDPAGMPRRILVRAWYPAGDVGDTPRRPYFTARERRDLAPSLAANFAFPSFIFAHFGRIATHGHVDAPVTPGNRPLPVLIFNHGYWCWPGQNTALMERLASHGYIVFAIGHPHDAATLRLPDGTAYPPSILKASASVPDPAMIAFWTAPDAAAKIAALPAYRAAFDRHRVMRSFDAWRADTRFLMAALRDGAVPPAAARLAARGDLARIGQVGMSFGGTTAASVCRDDPGCPGAVNLDGGEFDWRLYDAPYGRPLLLIHSDWVRYAEPAGSGDPGFTDNDLAYAPWRGAGANDPVVRLRIRDLRHLGLTDLPLSVRRPLRDRWYGALDGGQAIAAVNDLTLAFFDRTMRGAPDRTAAVIARHPAILRHRPAVVAR